MRVKAIVAVGAAAYLISLVATLPASLIAPRVTGWTQGSVALAHPAGSVFSGSATVRLSLPDLPPITIDRVQWDWHALALFRGQLAVGVQVKAAGLSGTLTVGRSPFDWHLRDATVDGPASALASFHSLLGSCNPTGRIALRIPSLRVDRAGFNGGGVVEWADAGLSLSTVKPLGTWRLSLAGEGGPAKLMLATQRGPLALTGNGSLSAAGKAVFTGEAKAEPGREADLAPFLANIGAKRADGVHVFSLP